VKESNEGKPKGKKKKERGWCFKLCCHQQGEREKGLPSKKSVTRNEEGKNCGSKETIFSDGKKRKNVMVNPPMKVRGRTATTKERELELVRQVRGWTRKKRLNRERCLTRE